MYARDFVYWLQGYMEIVDPREIPADKLEIIKNHLNLVFHFDLDPPKPSKKPRRKPVDDDEEDGPVPRRNTRDLGRTLIKC